MSLSQEKWGRRKGSFQEGSCDVVSMTIKKILAGPGEGTPVWGSLRGAPLVLSSSISLEAPWLPGE